MSAARGDPRRAGLDQLLGKIDALEAAHGPAGAWSPRAWWPPPP